MLWTLIGPTWKFPCLSEPTSGTDILQVTLPQIPTLKRQKQVVSEFLTARSVNQNEQGWFMIQNELAKVALLSDGLDPEDCVSWTPPLEGEKAEDQFQGMDAFFENLSSAGWGTVPALKTFYFKFCLAMLEQLVFRGESVDLVWGKLHSIPYRSNWRQVLMEMDMDENGKYLPSKVPWLNPKGRWQFPDMKPKAVQKRVTPRLLDMHLLGIERLPSSICRTIEVELGQLYWQNNRVAEDRKVHEGKLRRIANEIVAKQESILKLYVSFVENTRSPYPSVRGGSLTQSGKRQSFCQTFPPEPPFGLDTVFGNKGASVEGEVVDPLCGLLGVSDNEQEGEDMRNEGCDVDSVCVCASTG